ncbi:adenosylcobinamide-GDP ribazoletransferase [Clostridium polynesiense]|uniref:adenosylcobinamide-GDP ribazoletransferase n=1 Tax=Clostridium polynesiense TaxID=1325933 RepID=UPI0005915FA2|nr:adenosylcobinamide-GDP ribazoletransferase [Clostridium polynesiense]
MKRYFESFLLMVQMITRIPVKRSLPCQKEDFRRGAGFFALIGLIVGGIQYLLYLIFRKLFPAYVISILIILAEIFITGGFHIDGFGDTCDGYFAAKGKDKIIEIMKDSRIGTFACIGIVINILIKFESYKFIAASNTLSLMIIVIPMLSRASMLLISLIGRPAKTGGLGNLFINNVSLLQVIINFLLPFAAVALIADPIKAVVLTAGVITVTLSFNALCNSKINGITGDSLGAVNELSVLTALIIISSI